jgi:Putative Ig domain
MSIAHVQDLTSEGTDATSFELTDISAGGSGHLLVITVWTTAATALASVSDSAGNDWTYTTSLPHQDPPANQSPDESWFTSIAWCENSDAITSVTVDLAEAQYGFFTLSEYSGAATSDVLDTANSYAAGGTPESPSCTTAAAGELLIASCIGDNTPAGEGTGGWTTLDSNGFGFGSWLIAGAPGAYTAPYSGNTDCCGAIAAFIPASVTVTTSSLPGATEGDAYSATLEAEGGTPPYTWSVTAGSLPAGLSLDASTGVISGTPTGSGTSDFTVQAEDTGDLTGTAPLSITVAASSSGVYGPVYTALYESSIGPAPATFPDAPLDLECQIQLDGTWTDITEYIYNRQEPTPPVTITSGRPDESTQANPSSAQMLINNRAGQFSPRNPLGPYYGPLWRNTPIRLSVPDSGTYLRFDDDAISYCSTPDSSALRITGNIDVRIDIQPDNYMPCVLASKWGADGTAWALSLNGDGSLTFTWYDGTDTHQASSSGLGLPIPLGRVMIRALLTASTGTVEFYTAPDMAGSQTLLATVPGAGSTEIAAADGQPVAVGDSAVFDDSYGTQGCQGKIYEFALYNSSGTLVADPQFYGQDDGTTSFADGHGNTWTCAGTAEISGRNYRFHGQVPAWPPRWDKTGRDVWVPAAAAGVLRWISQGESNAPAQSAMKRAILTQPGALAPVGYWACEDGAGSSSFGSAIGGPPMTWAGGTGGSGDATTGPDLANYTGFLCSSALPTLAGSSWYWSIPGYTSNGSVVVRFLLSVPSSPDEDGSSPWVLHRVLCTRTVREFTLRYYSGGGLGISGWDDAGNSLFDTGAVAFAVEGEQLWVSMELTPSGSGIKYAITVLAPGAAEASAYSGTLGSGTIGNVIGGQVNPSQQLLDFTVGHISAQSEWTSLFSLADPLNAWQGETAGNRFTRLCSENGIAPRVWGFPDTTVAMGPQTPESLINLLEECEAGDTGADRGLIYEPRTCVGLGYRTLASMCNQAPAVTLDYGQAQLAGSLEPTDDDQLTVNDITVTRGAGDFSGGTYQVQLDDGSDMSISNPPAGIGDYAQQYTINLASDSQLPDVAGWMLHVSTTDLERYPVVMADLSRSEVADLMYNIADTGIGDFVDIDDTEGFIGNTDFVLPPGDIRQLALGCTEQLGGFFWKIAWNCVPEQPYETAIFDDPVYGRCNPSDSTLASPASSTATTLSVATADGYALWTTNAADFPFSVMIGGEEIEVTNIGGASSPQTFDVTRSVNGVVKAQDAGQDVTLAYPPVLALT